MADRFSGQSPALDSPAFHGFAITPHDSNDLPETTRAIFLGGPGAVVAVLQSGAELTFAGVAGGTLLPIRVTRIKATGTTATAIVGLI